MPASRMCNTSTRAGQTEKLDEWSDIAGASSGALARLSALKTGMRFVDWRHQARLADASVRLA
jgi:AraC-like DNA-binding protein